MVKPTGITVFILVFGLLANWFACADEYTETKAIAESGDATAQFDLGVMYQRGEGVPKDNAEAMIWFRKAAEQDYPNALYAVGVLYHMGLGVQTNRGEAVKWYQKGAEQGHLLAQYQLGSSYYHGEGVRKSKRKAAKWFREAAEQTYSKAQYSLAIMYSKGDGVPKSNAEAAKWFREAALAGHSKAQFNLGVMYQEGMGVPQDYTEAMMWTRMAAEAGHSKAQFNLGVMYQKGIGVPQNDAEAYVWHSLAATAGFESAIKNRDIHAMNLSPEVLSEAQKRTARLHEQITQGNVDSSLPPSSRAPTEIDVESSGSCFFVDAFGTVVTNNHVIDGHDKIEVITNNGTRSSATIIKSSNSLDLAVLGTGHQTPHFLTIAPHDSLTLGQEVFTIGYPVTDLLGDKPKYTEGSISALSGLNNDESWIQVSTPIQPGNSGGPLVNQIGQVVGIVTATAAVERFFSVTGSLPQNINWAIKADYARALIPGTSSNVHFSTKHEAIAHTEKSVCRVIAR